MLEVVENLSDVGKVIINLNSLKHNFKIIKDKIGVKTQIAAVLKADAYGLGIEKIALTLNKIGCNIFFVANLNEGIQLRTLIKNSNILVLNGPIKFSKKTYKDFYKYNLIPVINSLNDLISWEKFFKKKNLIALHFDTGMNRLGIPSNDVLKIKKIIKKNKLLDLFCIMSHLASADEPNNMINKVQKNIFDRIIKIFPKTLVSISNSSAIFNLKGFNYSFVRTGGALLGIDPNRKNEALKTVISVKAKVIQLRDLENEPVKFIGYNSTYRVNSKIKIAVLGIGYADGYPRNLSNLGYAMFKNKKLPIIGNISMDYMTIDISCFKSSEIKTGDWVELIGEKITIQKVASMAETIEYEILNNLGRRLMKDYIEVPHE